MDIHMYIWSSILLVLCVMHTRALFIVLAKSKYTSSKVYGSVLVKSIYHLSSILTVLASGQHFNNASITTYWMKPHVCYYVIVPRMSCHASRALDHCVQDDVRDRQPHLVVHEGCGKKYTRMCWLRMNSWHRILSCHVYYFVANALSYPYNT